MSAKDFHESRNNASGAKMDGAPEEIDLNVGSSVTPSTRAGSSAPRPEEGAVRTTEDGFRQVYRKAGGWAGELEEHPNDGENRIHLNGFSKKVDELSPKDLKKAQDQAKERAQAFSGIAQQVKGQSGSVIDLDQRAGSASRSAGETAGAAKPKMEFDPLKGRLVKIKAPGTEAPPKDQSYFDRISSRHPNPGVSAGEGIPAYDRHPKEIRRTLSNHITLIGDYLKKAKANQGPYTDEFGGQQLGFSEEHPLHAIADLAEGHHHTAKELYKEAENIKGTDSGRADELTRQAAISIHKASKLIHTPDFALAAGGWPDASVNPIETENNRTHAIVELQHPRVARLPKGVKLHNYILDTSEANNQSLVSAMLKRVAQGKHPGVDRNLVHVFRRMWKKPTPLGSEGWVSGEDVTPTGFKGDVLVNTKAATGEPGSNPFGRTRSGSAADNLAPSSPSAPKTRRQRKPAETKPEETVTGTGRRNTPPTTARAKAAKEKRTQRTTDNAASEAAQSQLSDISSEVSGIGTVRAEKEGTRRARAANKGFVFVEGDDGRPQVVNSAPKPVRLKKKTAAEIIAERRGN
jgi:hypothetical protein